MMLSALLSFNNADANVDADADVDANADADDL
jgi:hypothetical protein